LVFRIGHDAVADLRNNLSARPAGNNSQLFAEGNPSIRQYAS